MSVSITFITITSPPHKVENGQAKFKMENIEDSCRKRYCVEQALKRKKIKRNLNHYKSIHIVKEHQSNL